MANPAVTVANDTTTIPFDYIPIDTTAAVDFTDPAGPTGGVCPRGLYCNANAGNIVGTLVGTPGGQSSGTAPVAPAARTLAVASKGTVWGFFTGLAATGGGTSATGLFAIM